jgi:hypothetical protein
MGSIEGRTIAHAFGERGVELVQVRGQARSAHHWRAET